MSRFKYDIVDAKESIPKNEAGTGTISTFGEAVVGVGTAFLTDMIAGSYLVDLAQWEFRRVIRVDSDTVAFLEKPFTANIAALTTPQIIKKWKASPREISIKINSSDAAGLLDNQTFSGILTISKSSSDRTSQWDNIEPIIVDASGTSIKVAILY